MSPEVELIRALSEDLALENSRSAGPHRAIRFEYGFRIKDGLDPGSPPFLEVIT